MTNTNAVALSDEFEDSLRQRVRDQHGQMPSMPGTPSTIALLPAVLPSGRNY